MLIQYQEFNFRHKTLAIIQAANDIIQEYQNAGYELTLRQLYYQFVSRGLIANTERDYKNLGSIINDARLAGLIDWEAIDDRTRTARTISHWNNPSEIISTAQKSFRLNTRAHQETHVEVWIEKDALIGVIEGICSEMDITCLSCRGYLSQSTMWEAAQRLIEHEGHGQNSVIIHLGDHDPSGIDMTRDIQSRLNMFGSEAQVERVALNMDQIDQYQPPPNPAKITDTRAVEYIRKYGGESWELDALDPRAITQLVRDHVGRYTDADKQSDLVELQERHRAELTYVANNWEKIIRKGKA